MLSEIKLAMKCNKKIEDIKEICVDSLEFEDELIRKYDIDVFVTELKEYIKVEQ